MTRIHWLTLLTLLTLSTATASVAQAQSVWRCGADARSYTNAPCPGGHLVAVADPRSPTEVAEARQVVDRDRRLARQLAAERQERDRELLARGSGLAAIKPLDDLKPKARSRSEAHRPAAKRRSPSATAGTSAATGRGSLQKLD